MSTAARCQLQLHEASSSKNMGQQHGMAANVFNIFTWQQHSKHSSRECKQFQLAINERTRQQINCTRQAAETAANREHHGQLAFFSNQLHIRPWASHGSNRKLHKAPGRKLPQQRIFSRKQ
ncbi:hypothetical protein ACLOJK_036655, partial [Asimina triloba]